MPGMVPALSTERELLLAFVAQQRYAMKLTAYGLTDEQARQAPSASPLTIGGLIKHVIAAERGWMTTVLQRNAASDEQTDFDERMAQHNETFNFRPEETLEGLFVELDEAAAETERIVNEIGDLDHPVPVPKGAPWLPDDLEAWSLRWVLLHLVEEIARHAGHADIVRESVDGATTFPLMAAAEGWPATEWLQPWEPR